MNKEVLKIELDGFSKDFVLWFRRRLSQTIPKDGYYPNIYPEKSVEHFKITDIVKFIFSYFDAKKRYFIYFYLLVIC